MRTLRFTTTMIQHYFLAGHAMPAPARVAICLNESTEQEGMFEGVASITYTDAYSRCPMLVRVLLTVDEAWYNALTFSQRMDLIGWEIETDKVFNRPRLIGFVQGWIEDPMWECDSIDALLESL